MSATYFRHQRRPTKFECYRRGTNGQLKKLLILGTHTHRFSITNKINSFATIAARLMKYENSILTRTRKPWSHFYPFGINIFINFTNAKREENISSSHLSQMKWWQNMTRSKFHCFQFSLQPMPTMPNNEMRKNRFQFGSHSKANRENFNFESFVVCCVIPCIRCVVKCQKNRRQSN